MTTLIRHADALHRPGSWLFGEDVAGSSSTLVARDPRHGKPRDFGVCEPWRRLPPVTSMG